MNDEIKEMLECLKAINDGGCVWPVYQHEAKILLDYITNLQNDNKRLQHNEKVFKGRNEKAIEYVNTHKPSDTISFPLMKKDEENQVKSCFDYEFREIYQKELLEILQGSDKE